MEEEGGIGGRGRLGGEEKATLAEAPPAGVVLVERRLLFLPPLLPRLQVSLAVVAHPLVSLEFFFSFYNGEGEGEGPHSST